MFARISAQNYQTFENFNFEFSMSRHNAHYQSYKNAPTDDDYLNHHVKDQNVLPQYILVINTNHLDDLELKMVIIFSK